MQPTIPPTNDSKNVGGASLYQEIAESDASVEGEGGPPRDRIS